MNKRDVAAMIDHTILKPEATTADVARSIEGETHTEKVPAAAPSSTMRATSAVVASGLRIVWSIIAATSRLFIDLLSVRVRGWPGAGPAPSWS